MDLSKVIKYLERYDYYSGASFYNEMLVQLNDNIKEYKLPAVKKAIREGFGICPTLVKVFNGEYNFLRYTKQANVNGVLVRLSLGQPFDGYSLWSHSYYYSDDHPVYTTDMGDVPLSGIIDMFEECEQCGVVCLEGSSHVCSVCAATNKLHEYSAKAENLLDWTRGKETLFGVELEYEDITAREVGKHLKTHAIAKHDGSIHSGVEIVTKPAPLASHKEAMQAFYKSVPVKGASNTGMHVHVDKEKLSAYQIGFMMKFLNDKDLIPNIEVVAGRSYSTNTYCRAKENLKMSWGNSFDEQTYRLSKQATDKYSPLNTAKRNTIEVRIFSSPESYEEMCAKLDFVAALVKYSSPYSVSVKTLQDKFKWDTFTAYVQENKKEFQHFVSYFLKG